MAGTSAEDFSASTVAFDRRSMIKKAAAGATAAWAAPLVLSGTAGAATTQYFMKYENGGCFSTIGGGDPCPQGEDDGKSSGCGAGHFSVSFSGDVISITRLDPNCTITGLYFKAGQSCSPNQAGSGAGGTYTKENFSPATNNNGRAQAFSHVNISYSCSSGSI